MIELGAGVGAPGIAAALAGASEVCITDREPLSLHCAALSARSSGLSARVLRLEAGPSGRVVRDHGQGLEAEAEADDGRSFAEGSKGDQPQVTCVLLDWTLPVPKYLLGR